MDAELKAFSTRITDHLFGHILPFWSGPALDRENGGWVACLSNDLRPDHAQPKGVIVHSRVLWAFSAAYRLRPELLFRQMADRAFDYLVKGFWDRQYGGAYWRLNDHGGLLDGVKKTYGQAFCIYALTEYHQATGSSAALSHAIEIFELVERHTHDLKHGGYFEVASRDWSQILDAPLSEKDLNGKKSMNSHLHVLEAYTTLYRAWRESRVERRLRELIRLFEEKILDSRTYHLQRLFDERWNVCSDTHTFGHDIEASWLLCEAAEVLHDAHALGRAQQIAVPMAEMVLSQALDHTGGISYEGKGGKVIDTRKECWPQAEAVVGFLNAFQICREPKYLEAARGVWDYIQNNLVDRTHGEWFWRINEDGRPDPALPKVSERKGPYHGTRMCLEAIHRLKRLRELLPTGGSCS